MTTTPLEYCEFGKHIEEQGRVFQNLVTGEKACAAHIARRYIRGHQKGARKWARKYRESHAELKAQQTKAWRRTHTESRNQSRKRNYDKNRKQKWNVRNKYRPWGPSELRRISDPRRPKDRLLSAQLGRSVQAIQAARAKHKKSSQTT